jgi:hypothetical protein
VNWVKIFHFDGFCISGFRGYDFIKSKDPVHYSQSQIETTDHQIDQLVYELYGLKGKEILRSSDKINSPGSPVTVSASAPFPAPALHNTGGQALNLGPQGAPTTS